MKQDARSKRGPRNAEESGNFHPARLLWSDADRKAALAEIAQFANITRQGVRDSIKRAEGTLLEMEERLGLARKFRVYRQKLEQIVDCANEIAFEAGRYPGSRKIEQDAKKIVELAQQIED